MTDSGYIVHYHCHVCGRMHLVIVPFPLPGGPTEPCTPTHLYVLEATRGRPFLTNLSRLSLVKEQCHEKYTLRHPGQSDARSIR